MGMATVVQSYPETCHPLDTLESMKAQSEAYVFLDVFARGHYNSYYYANMKNEGTMPEILDGDLDLSLIHIQMCIRDRLYIAIVHQLLLKHHKLL